MKFIGIWILNPLKTSDGQPVALKASVFHFLAWVLIDTIIHPCFKHAVSHVARVECIWTLKFEQQNAIDHVCAFSEFDFMLCFLTELPGITAQICMKKNHIVVQQTKKFKHGGSNAKTG